MNDVNTALRQYLEKTALGAYVGNHLYAGVDVPPVGYKPTDGPALCFKTRGGRIADSEAVIDASVQFKCYGVDQVEADTCYRTLVDSLHVHGAALVRWAFVDVIGQPIVEPATGWYAVLTFFQVTITKG